MIQFKEKGGRPKTRASLFTYPCLMAADILLYDAGSVPVGGDQDQHVELARDLAIRFNRDVRRDVHGARLAKAALAARVTDLVDPTSKMSKSAPGRGGRCDPDARPAGSDQTQDRACRHRLRQRGPLRPGDQARVSNLLDVIAVIEGGDPRDVAVGSRRTGRSRLRAPTPWSTFSDRSRPGTTSWSLPRTSWLPGWPGAPKRPRAWPIPSSIVPSGRSGWSRPDLRRPAPRTDRRPRPGSSCVPDSRTRPWSRTAIWSASRTWTAGARW